MEKYKNKNWLQKKYWKDELTVYQIAKLCNCSQTTIFRWLKKLDVKIRSLGEARHLATGNHCNLSNKAKQWIDGELFGDMCLCSTAFCSARIHYSSKYLEYIQYISNTLNSFGIKQCGKIRSGSNSNKKYDNYFYRYASQIYAELLTIYKRWYPEPKRKKVIPRDLKLTPLVLRQEMIGDGSLLHCKNRKPRIQLSTCGFPISDVEWLVGQLKKLGFKATRQSASNRIGISVYSTKQFLDYIGKSPVKCYQYKFSY